MVFYCAWRAYNNTTGDSIVRRSESQPARDSGKPLHHVQGSGRMDARSAGGALLLVVVVGVGETPSLLVNVIIVIKRTCAICRWMNEIKSAIVVLVRLTDRFMILFIFGNI